MYVRKELAYREKRRGKEDLISSLSKPQSSLSDSYLRHVERTKKLVFRN